MTIFGWATLIVCVVVLVLRIPDAIQGRNRTVFAILLLATVASLLRMPDIFRAIDQVFGGWGVTILAHRYLVFTAMFLVGLRVTKGLTAERGQRLIAGPVGRWALALSCLVLAVTFFLVHTPGPGGVFASVNSGGHDAALVRLYAVAGHSYPTFVSLVLIPPLLAVLRTGLPRLVRAGALLMFIGALTTVARLPVSLAPQEWAPALATLTHAAVLGYVLGFTAFWFSGLTAQPRPNAAAAPNKQPRTSPGGNRLHPSGK